MTTKIDSRFIDLPSSEGAVYVIKNGAFVEANVVDMSASWSPTIDDEEIVLTVDQDMIPYQLTGNNTEVNV